MRKLVKLLLIVFAGLATPLAMSAETKIEIIKPQEGALFDIQFPPILEYQINLVGDSFGNRDRIYVYVDDQRVGRLHQMSGSYALDRMSLGEHEICIRVVSENTKLAVLQHCVKVKVFGRPEWRVY